MAESQTNRRTFLKTTSFAAAISLFPQITFAEDSSHANQPKGHSALDKPSAMIPPVPAILLSVKGAEEGECEVTVVWTFVINSHPPQIGISVHDEHIALNLIRQHKAFVLNVPTRDMATAFDQIDMHSKQKMDKYKLTGLSRGSARNVDAPTVEEAPIQLECKTFNEIRVPPSRTLFLAEVVATSVQDHVCTDGRLNVQNVPFFGMTVGSGEFYCMGEKVGHIGQSLGRDDIRY